MKTTLTIKGMHCPSCTILVKEAVMDVKGVKNAEVDLKKGTAVIDAADTVKEKDLIDAIRKEGYDARSK